MGKSLKFRYRPRVELKKTPQIFCASCYQELEVWKNKTTCLYIIPHVCKRPKLTKKKCLHCGRLIPDRRCKKVI